jgi:signal transduction histidine kinase
MGSIQPSTNNNNPNGNPNNNSNNASNNNSNRLEPSINLAMNRRISSLVGRDHESDKSGHEVTNAATDDDMYDMFLNFNPRISGYQCSELQLDYVSFKRSDGHSAMQLFILALLSLYGGTRFWFARNEEYYVQTPIILVAIFLGSVTICFLWVGVLLKLSLLSMAYNIRPLQPFHAATVRFYKSRFGQYLDDAVVVFTSLWTGVYVVSQALAPACPPGAAMFDLQACNPSKSVGALAPEVMVLAVCMVVVLQLLARGGSRAGLVCSWVVMIVAINTSLWLVGSISYLWINAELAVAMAISYELERMPLRHFIKSLRVVEASEINAHLRVAVVQYQVRESERALEAKRSMVRHIGHEIRNPLNIIGVGTDVLSKELKRLGPVVPSVVLEVVEGMKEASGTALEVVNELLMFEKLAAGMTTIETAPARIVRFVEMAMKQHTIPARAKEIDFKLTVEARDRDMGVDIDPIKMTVVFRNLFRYHTLLRALHCLLPLSSSFLLSLRPESVPSTAT